MDRTEYLASYLAKLLADVVTTRYVAQGFHWNVTGVNFQQFHEFFQDIYEDIDGSIDPIAENIRKLNFESPFQLAEFTALATKIDVPDTDEPVAMCASLYQHNENIRACLLKAIAVATDLNEQGVINFLAERYEQHSKWQWQLRTIIGDSVADIYQIDPLGDADSFFTQA